MTSPADQHFKASTAAYLERRFCDAEAELRRALALDPTRVDFHNNLGGTLLAQARYAEAEASFRRAIELDPDYVLAWGNLGSTLAIQGYGSEPLRVFAQALKLAPRDLSLYRKAGHELLNLGHTDAALRCFELVLRHMPDNPDAVSGLANVLDRKRSYQEAHDLLAPWIRRGVYPVNITVSYARICKRLGCPERALEPLEYLRNSRLPRPEATYVLFTLGMLYDSLEDWGRAWEAYSEANELEGLDWDPDAHDAEVDALIATFDRSSFAARPTAKGLGSRTVFIVGMPRSGTSLVEQVLASHPAVFGAGEREELRLLTLGIPRELGGGATWPGCVDDLTEAEMRFAGDWYEAQLGREASHARIITDKMPQNYLHLGLAAHALPEARVVHCVRDPLDTSLSCYFQQFHHAHAWSTRLDWLARTYRSYTRLYDHWRQVLPLSTLEIDYETMVSSPEPTMRKLVDFCGLDWNPACLRFHETRRSVRTASYHQVTRPIYKGSIGRAASYARWIGPLREGLGLHGELAMAS